MLNLHKSEEVMSEKLEMYVVSNNNHELAQNIKMYADMVNMKVQYSSDLGEMCFAACSNKRGLYFVDKNYKYMAEGMHSLLSNPRFNTYMIVFVDDDKEYYEKWLIQDKLFVIGSNEININTISWITDKFKNIARQFGYLRYIDLLNIELSKMLDQFGVEYKRRGYEYIKAAVNIVLRSNCVKCSLHNYIYPTIASRYLTSIASVEKNFRLAIDCAKRNNSANIIEVFGSTRVSNKEFLNYLVDKLRNYHLTIGNE